MSSLPEALLARLTTPDRAAAIYGDITELATTKSRLWFWTTYIRALIALGWRTPIAFIVGFMGVAIFQYTAIRVLHAMQLWFGFAVLPGQHTVYFYLSSHPYIQRAIFYSALQLWFLVPFAAIRYGSGDRLVRLSFAQLLMTIGMILSVPILSPLLSIACILVIAASIISTDWRRPAITLITAIAVGDFMVFNLRLVAHIFSWIYAHANKPLQLSSGPMLLARGYTFPHTMFWVVTWSIVLFDMLLVAIVCSRMHKRPSHQRMVIA